jgi:hypothetical protein
MLATVVPVENNWKAQPVAHCSPTLLIKDHGSRRTNLCGNGNVIAATSLHKTLKV